MLQAWQQTTRVIVFSLVSRPQNVLSYLWEGSRRRIWGLNTSPLPNNWSTGSYKCGGCAESPFARQKLRKWSLSSLFYHHYRGLDDNTIVSACEFERSVISLASGSSHWHYAALASCTWLSSLMEEKPWSIFLCWPVGLNRVPNFAEYRVFEAVFAEYWVPIPSIWQNVNIFNCINLWIISTK